MKRSRIFLKFQEKAAVFSVLHFTFYVFRFTIHALYFLLRFTFKLYISKTSR
jgi:hypothetical protein